MRFIENKEVTTLKGLTRESIRALEARRLGVLKREDGTYIIIKACGLGSGIDKVFKDAAELNEYVKKAFWR